MIEVRFDEKFGDLVISQRHPSGHSDEVRIPAEVEALESFVVALQCEVDAVVRHIRVGKVVRRD